MKEIQEIKNDIMTFRNFELITKNKELEILQKLNNIEKKLEHYKYRKYNGLKMDKYFLDESGHW